MGSLSETSIEKYAEKATPSQLTFTKKIVNAYLYSLLLGSAVTDEFERLESATNPNEGSSRLLWELDDRVSLYEDEKYRRPVVASIRRKNIDLFTIIGDTMFTDYEFFMTYGSNRSLSVLSTTDEIPTGYTDQGGYTDMSEDSLPGGLYRIKYDVDTIEEISSEIDFSLNMFGITIPSRYMVYLQPTLVHTVSFTAIDPYLTITYNGIQDPTVVAYINSLTTSEFNVAFGSILVDGEVPQFEVTTDGTKKTYKLNVFGYKPTEIKITDSNIGTFLVFDIDPSVLFEVEGMDMYGIDFTVDFDTDAVYRWFTTDDVLWLTTDDGKYLGG